MFQVRLDDISKQLRDAVFGWDVFLLAVKVRSVEKIRASRKNKGGSSSFCSFFFQDQIFSVMVFLEIQFGATCEFVQNLVFSEAKSGSTLENRDLDGVHDSKSSLAVRNWGFRRGTKTRL